MTVTINNGNVEAGVVHEQERTDNISETTTYGSMDAFVNSLGQVEVYSVSGGTVAVHFAEMAPNSTTGFGYSLGAVRWVNDIELGAAGARSSRADFQVL
jgi:hypothetical protein